MSISPFAPPNLNEAHVNINVADRVSVAYTFIIYYFTRFADIKGNSFVPIAFLELPWYICVRYKYTCISVADV